LKKGDNIMKTFHRTFLPKSIDYNGRTYYKETARESVTPNNYYTILVKVLPTSLKGKLDLHNKPYKPTEHYFVAREG